MENVNKKRVRLILEPVSKRISVLEGTTVLEAVQNLDIPIYANCGGKGTCGKCKIQISRHDVNLSPLTEIEKKMLSEEEISKGFRLACQARIFGNSRIFLTDVFLERVSKILTEGVRLKTAIRPKFWKIMVDVAKCSEYDKINSDFDRLNLAIQKEIPMLGVYNQKIETTFSCLKKIPLVVREKGGKVCVTLESNIAKTNEPLLILNVESGNKFHDIFGVAIDIGTTTLVGYLIDLNSGEIASVESRLNPQTSIAEDVISRIEYASKSQEHLEKAQKLVHEAVDDIIQHLCQKAKISKENIVEIAVVGNTVMHHLFFGLPVNFLGLNPFPPVVQNAISIRNYHLNLREITMNSEIYSPPVLAGYVGADTIADIIATRMHLSHKQTLLIDIGTNGELVLGNRSFGLAAASCAAGSAFEGAHLKHGMRGTYGAIEKISIDPITWEPTINVIGDIGPIGLCGSAIIDIAAELLRAKIITRSGNFNKELISQKMSPRLRAGSHGLEYIIYSPNLSAKFGRELKNGENSTKAGHEITVSQEDIREIQKAKGAFLSGARMLMQVKDLKTGELEEILIAGAFGTYIDIENALFIGLFPDSDLTKIRQIGNAAGMGAQALLINTDLRTEAEDLRQTLKYVEISDVKDFAKEFAESMIFPHRDLDVFPSLKEKYKDLPMR